MNQKKTILMIPSWYPTKDNPFQGSFFKEQAIAVRDFFDFIVFHIQIKHIFLISYYLKSFFNKNNLRKINEELNTTEYNFVLYIPYFFKIYNVFFSFLKKRKLHIREDGIGKYFPDSYLNFQFNQILKFFKKNKDFYYDYVYGVTAQDKAIEAELFAKAKKVPYILAEHAPFPWPGTSLSDKQKIAIENSNLFLAISNDKIRQVLLQNIHLNRIEYLGNLVDETMFPFEPSSHTLKTFIIVAANSFYKQYDLFIKIFNELKVKTDKPFKIIVAGYNANKGYSKNAEELISKFKQSNFFSNIELIPSVQRNELHILYNRSDCFIMTSIQEGQPVSALEAACCGLPIFSTRCGGVEDYVTPEIGRIFDITDYKNFAEGLKDFLEGGIIFNSKLIHDTIISKFGIKTFKENFSKFINSTNNI